MRYSIHNMFVAAPWNFHSRQLAPSYEMHAEPCQSVDATHTLLQNDKTLIYIYININIYVYVYI